MSQAFIIDRLPLPTNGARLRATGAFWETFAAFTSRQGPISRCVPGAPACSTGHTPLTAARLGRTGARLSHLKELGLSGETRRLWFPGRTIAGFTSLPSPLGN